MVTEKGIGQARLHGKGVFGNTELKFLSYLGIRSDDPRFFTKLNCSLCTCSRVWPGYRADRDTLIFTAH